MTADQPPAKAILSDEEWARCWSLMCDSDADTYAHGEQAVDERNAAYRLVKADRAALRAKLAERDRLLARCVPMLEAQREDHEYRGNSVADDCDALLADIRTALEDTPRG